MTDFLIVGSGFYGSVLAERISNILKALPIMDIRKLNKYMTEIEPGIVFKTTARIQGGDSVTTFLRINKNLFWPDI